MATPRSEFVEKLLVAAPALASSSLVPIFTCFWFSGDSVMAFNDMIAIRVPCRTDFAGAVQGSTLLALLKASRAREVEMLAKGNELQIRAAGARLKLPVFPVEDFVFEMPKPAAKDAASISAEAFRAGLAACLRSVSSDTSVADQLGVTVIPSAGALDLYATNDRTMTHARVATKKSPFQSRVVLSGQFCEQLLRLTTKDKQIALELHDDYALLSAGDGVTLFGRLIEVDKPLDFAGVAKDHLPGNYVEAMCPVPARLPAALDRAVVVADTSVATGDTSMTITDGKIRLVTKSERGEASDGVAIGDHADAAVKINPALVRSALEFYDKILVAKRCVVLMKGADTTHMISSREE